MPGPEPEIDRNLLAKMRADWDRRARENARYYIATGKELWREEEFFRSGEANVEEQILTDMTNICQGKSPAEMRVLEIGCGAGRLTRALAKVFGRVDAVDVSGEMVLQARQALRGRLAMRQLAQVYRETVAGGREALRRRSWIRFRRTVAAIPARIADAVLDFPGARFFQNNGADLQMFPDAQFDFAYSFIVFQHIPSKSVIENYIREVWRVLRPGALFKFQVQGGEFDVPEGDTWLGASFREEEMREIAARCGFEMRHCHNFDSQYLWLWFFKIGAGRPLPSDG